MARPRKTADPAVTPVDDTTPDRAASQRDEAQERLADRLVQLASARAREAMDPADPAHAGYWEWRAREARAGLSPAERIALRADAEAFADALAARMAELGLSAVPQAHGSRPVPTLVAGAPIERAAAPLTGADAVRAATGARCALRFDLAVAAGVGRELWDEPATSWVELPDDVADGRHVALTVHGDSMEPMLHAGDTILVRLDARATVGDVIVARRPEDGHVVKRVSEITGDRLVLSSLNAAYDALEVPNAPGTVVGTVVLRWCRHGERRG